MIIFSVILFHKKITEKNLKKKEVSKSEDKKELVTCFDCNGTGIMKHDENSDLVKLGLIPKGLEEECQTCYGRGNLYECIRPNGMIYYLTPQRSPH